MNDLDINGWLLWFILTLGHTVFVTRSAWVRWARTAFLIKFRSPAMFCGGCVGFWIGLYTARWFPLEVAQYLAYAASALAGMLVGYAFGSGELEGATESAEVLRKLDAEAKASRGAR